MDGVKSLEAICLFDHVLCKMPKKATLQEYTHIGAIKG